jgi:hypothetical protein
MFTCLDGNPYFLNLMDGSLCMLWTQLARDLKRGSSTTKLGVSLLVPPNMLHTVIEQGVAGLA